MQSEGKQFYNETV